MDYGGYVLITIIVLAAIFFVLALHNRGNIKTLRFTSCGFVAFFVAGLVSYYSSPSKDLKISLFVVIGIALVFLWFYRGSVRDERNK